MSRITRKWIGAFGAVSVIAGQMWISPLAIAADGNMIEEGKEIAFDRKKGNCLACHMIEGGTAAGNIAPPLIAMKGRYPNKSDLRKQIWDPTVNNPESSMPPFGKHGVLSEAELERVVEFIWSL